MLQNRIARPISHLLASRSRFGNDLVCEAFQTLQFVDHRVEQQMLGAGGSDLDTLSRHSAATPQIACREAISALP